jgi:dipeptidyl-peptidase-3
MTTIEAILNDEKLKHHVVPEEIPVVKLDVTTAFSELTPKEKMYAHYISEASWAGTPIVLEQASFESPVIFKLLLALFKSLFTEIPKADLSAATLAKYCDVSESAMNNLLNYAAMFLGNSGNYKSFGDQKFIPRLDVTEFEKIVLASKNQTALNLFNKCKKAMYSVEEDELELGFAHKPGQKTCSSYYSENVTKEDAMFISKFLQEKNISGINTRVFKTQNGDKTEFEVRIASARTKENGVYPYEGTTIRVITGDFADALKIVAQNLEKAIPFAANENQVQMHKKYVDHFLYGCITDHEDSQRWWIKDKGPVVECNIGFIESYRDPLHLRAEWEGFVAVVNKEMSAKFNSLVENAEGFIKLLPWNKSTTEFEKDKFHRPDFTSLEVLCFASSGIPAGINIPNYDNIRMNEGFKNVSLGNVLNASNPKEELTFIAESDKDLFNKYRGKAFEVQVGLHELLGHGSGKLLSKLEDGSYNFDTDKVINPITGQKVDSYYAPGETYYSKFSDIASSYEECRAESVGIYLCIEDEILKIFGYEGQEAENVMYINWLLMCRAGILALEFYNPESKRWGQAHMQARYCIFRILLEASKDNGFVQLTKGDDVCVTMDKSKIKTVGIPAMADFLTKLNVYKAVADYKSASEMYKKYTSVEDEFLQLRTQVIAKKKPRRVFVQSRTVIENAQVKLIEYEPTPIGLINSFIDRFE